MSSVGDLIGAANPTWWPRLGEPSGTTMDDAATGNHDGTYTGSPTLGVAGITPNDSTTGATFSATAYGSVGTQASFGAGTNDFALFTLFQHPTGLGSTAFLAEIGGTSVELWTDGDALQSRFQGGGSSATSGRVDDGRYRACWLYGDRDGNLFFEIDGAASGTPLNISGSAATNMTVGASSYIGRRSSGNGFAGTMKDPAFWASGAPDAATRRAIAEAGLNGPTGQRSARRRGEGARNTGSESSYAITPTFDFVGDGSLAVLVVAYDNSGTNGADPFNTCTDTNGNTWTSRQAALNDPGAASAGVALRILTSDMAGGVLDTGDIITIDFGGTTTVARAYALWEVVGDPGETVSYGTGATETATTASPSITTSSITSGDLVIGAVGREGNDAVTEDSDTSNGSWTHVAAAGVGTTTSGVQVASQGKLATGTATQTYNPTYGSSRDGAEAWVSFTFAGSGGTDGDAAVSVAPSASATGTPVIAGTAAASVSPSVAATGSSAITGTAAASVAPAASATGSGVVAGTAAVSVAASAAATGTPVVAGTAAASVQPSVAGSGEPVDLEPVTGDAAVSVAVSAAATGTPVVRGQASAGVAAIVASTGSGIVTGSGAVAIPAVMAAALGASVVAGTGAVSVAPRVAGSGAPPYDWEHATGVVSLGARAVGVVTIAGSDAGVVTVTTRQHGVVTT